MRSVVAVGLLTLASFSTAADRKRKDPPRPAEIEVIEISVRRSEGRVSLDGRVKNSGEKAAAGLVLFFDFMAPGKQVVTTKRGDLELETLEPNGEAEFHVYSPDPPRAVAIRVQAQDANERDLRVIKSGPYAID